MQDLLEIAARACNDPDPAALHSMISLVIGQDHAPQRLIELGIFCREHQRAPGAMRLFEHVMQKFPDCVAGYYEAAFVHRLAGQHLEAARLLLAARLYAPRDVRLTIFLVHMLFMVGAVAEAEAAYRGIIALADSEEAARLESVREFGSYITTWPKGRAMLLLDRLKRGFGYLDVHAVAAMVIDAVEHRRPFALIRLGDGEGSCINLGVEDEGAYRSLYAQNREEMNAMWFGPRFPATETGFAALSQRIAWLALKTDLIGIPYEGWLEHEYKIASLRGIPCLLNILRGFESLPLSGAVPRLCSQQIHVELQQSGELERIIRHAKRVSLISCLTELPDLLSKAFELEDVEFYRIPGERGSAASLGQHAVSGVHYPDCFKLLLASLERPHHGRLFLIAGGILGKFYAETIRRFGGVALDIGSVADGWARKATRPGMGTGMALRA